MFLILDFTKSFRLAIFSDHQIISKELKTKRNISEILIIEIEKFLKKSNKNFRNIKSIGVITGPGSFTGTRSALTFAKSLKIIKKLGIFGISKFEIINLKINSKLIKNRCILLHFKKNQFFVQKFKDNKAIDQAKLMDLDNKKFKFNKNTTYIYDNILFKELLENNIGEDIKKNFHFIDYNLFELQEIILKNTIDNPDPKPLYISNYY